MTRPPRSGFFYPEPVAGKYTLLWRPRGDVWREAHYDAGATQAAYDAFFERVREAKPGWECLLFDPRGAVAANLRISVVVQLKGAK